MVYTQICQRCIGANESMIVFPINTLTSNISSELLSYCVQVVDDIDVTRGWHR